MYINIIEQTKEYTHLKFSVDSLDLEYEIKFTNKCNLKGIKHPVEKLSKEVDIEIISGDIPEIVGLAGPHLSFEKQVVYILLSNKKKLKGKKEFCYFSLSHDQAKTANALSFLFAKLMNKEFMNQKTIN